MSRRKFIFTEGEYYHIFNKSVAGEIVFGRTEDVLHVTELIDYYRFAYLPSFSTFKKKTPSEQRLITERTMREQEPMVELYALALMPNHYHIVLRQLQNFGIKKFISNVQNSFAKYFNEKNDRQGSVFLHSFGAVRIESEEQFKHVCRYVHINPIVANLLAWKDLLNSPISSLRFYANATLQPLCIFNYDENKAKFINTSKLLALFGSVEKHLKFVQDQIDYGRSLKKIEASLKPSNVNYRNRLLNKSFYNP